MAPEQDEQEVVIATGTIGIGVKMSDNGDTASSCVYRDNNDFDLDAQKEWNQLRHPQMDRRSILPTTCGCCEPGGSDHGPPMPFAQPSGYHPAFSSWNQSGSYDHHPWHGEPYAGYRHQDGPPFPWMFQGSHTAMTDQFNGVYPIFDPANMPIMWDIPTMRDSSLDPPYHHIAHPPPNFEQPFNLSIRPPDSAFPLYFESGPQSHTDWDYSLTKGSQPSGCGQCAAFSAWISTISPQGPPPTQNEATRQERTIMGSGSFLDKRRPFPSLVTLKQEDGSVWEPLDESLRNSPTDNGVKGKKFIQQQDLETSAVEEAYERERPIFLGGEIPRAGSVGSNSLTWGANSHILIQSIDDLTGGSSTTASKSMKRPRYPADEQEVVESYSLPEDL